jgi:hypothetical protein
MRKSPILTLVLLASTSLVALTGCSAPAEPAADEQPTTSTSQAPTEEESPEASEPATGEQTVAESCAIAQQTMSTIQSEMTDAMTTMGAGDMSGALEALETFEASLGDAVAEVTNPEVDAALSNFQSKFASFNELLATVDPSDPASIDQTALTTASTDIQTAAQEIATLCS